MSARMTLAPNAAATATAVSTVRHVAVLCDDRWFASWSISSPRRGDMPESARGRVGRQSPLRAVAGGAATVGQGIRQLTTDSSERVRSAAAVNGLPRRRPVPVPIAARGGRTRRSGESVGRPSPDLRVLPRDTRRLLYRGFLLLP